MLTLCHDLEVVPRPHFSLFNLFLCCDIKDPFRDIDLSPQLEVCCSVGFLYCDQASSKSKRHCCDLNFLVATEILLSMLSFVSNSSSMLQESVSRHIRLCRDIYSTL